MTRLIFTSKEAANLINKSITLSNDLDSFFILSRKMKSCKMIDLAKLISDKTRVIGLRPGEILSEDLISANEVKHAYQLIDDYSEYIVIIKNNDSNLLGKKLTKPVNSKNAEKMNKSEMISLLNDVKNHLASYSSIKFNY